MKRREVDGKQEIERRVASKPDVVVVNSWCGELDCKRGPNAEPNFEQVRETLHGGILSRFLPTQQRTVCPCIDFGRLLVLFGRSDT